MDNLFSLVTDYHLSTSLIVCAIDHAYDGEW